MRHGSSNRRPTRARGGNRNQGPNKNKVFDSSGPEVRIRGTAFQIAEKYETLAKDATASGDIILAESYLQHAEHYQRIISSYNAEAAEQSYRQQQNAPAPQQNVDENAGNQKALEDA